MKSTKPENHYSDVIHFIYAKILERKKNEAKKITTKTSKQANKQPTIARAL